MTNAYRYARYTNKVDDDNIQSIVTDLEQISKHGMLWEVLIEACNVLEKTPAELADAIEKGKMEWDI